MGEFCYLRTWSVKSRLPEDAVLLQYRWLEKACRCRSPQRQGAECKYCNENSECGRPKPHITPPVLSCDQQANTTQQKGATDQGQDTEQDRGSLSHDVLLEHLLNVLRTLSRRASRLSDLWPKFIPSFVAL
jgi:hypothetical protein